MEGTAGETPEGRQHAQVLSIERMTGYQFGKPLVIADALASKSWLSNYALLGMAQMRAIWMDEYLASYMNDMNSRSSGVLHPNPRVPTKSDIDTCEAKIAHYHEDFHLCYIITKHDIHLDVDRGPPNQQASKIAINAEILRAILGMIHVDNGRQQYVLQSIMRFLGVSYTSPSPPTLDNMIKQFASKSIVPTLKE